ncbi:hypothetical protein [Nocardioides sp.]|uniref:hypothetical protein n=1 Tax=Nocardioides sp. TaxID=35761 RepID=UPI003562947E
MLPERAPDDPRLSRIHLRKDLIASGFDDKGIHRLVADGTLHRLRYGAYVNAAAWRACDEVGRHGLIARAVLRRAQADVVLSHVSGLGEWDVPIWDQALDEVHVTRLDRRAGRREAGVCQHEGLLRPEDHVARNGVLVTSPTRTALDCLSVLDVEHGMVIVGDLLHRGLTTADRLAECAAFMEQWPGSLRHRVVLKHASGRCESVGEHRTLYLIWQQGLPAPIPQYRVLHPVTGEVVAIVDFAWPELNVFLEFDGKVKYEKLLKDGESPSDVVVREKRREELVSRLTGWRCVRIVWADLYRPEQTAAAIRSAFQRQSVVV